MSDRFHFPQATRVQSPRACQQCGSHEITITLHHTSAGTWGRTYGVATCSGCGVNASARLAATTADKRKHPTTGDVRATIVQVARLLEDVCDAIEPLEHMLTGYHQPPLDLSLTVQLETEPDGHAYLDLERRACSVDEYGGAKYREAISLSSRSEAEWLIEQLQGALPHLPPDDESAEQRAARLALPAYEGRELSLSYADDNDQPATAAPADDAAERALRNARLAAEADDSARDLLDDILSGSR